MIRKTLTLIACGGMLALFACSGEDVGPKYGSSGDFCSAYAETLCKNLAAGCGTNEDNCKSRAQANCIADAGTRPYRSGGAEECIDKTNEVFSKKTYSVADDEALDDVCARVFGGTVAKNAPCQADAECADKLICDKGVCADKTEKANGEACNNPGDTCGKEAYCGDQGALKFCIPKKKLGELCTEGSVPCLEELRCVGSCKEKVRAGDPCDTDADCPVTTTPGYCDPGQKKCLPRFGLGTESCKQLGGT
jgi:hypothetical protein